MSNGRRNAPLTNLISRCVRIGPSRPTTKPGVKPRVSASRKTTISLVDDAQRAPHRVTLAAGGPWLAEQVILLEDVGAGGGGHRRGSVARRRVDDEDPIDQTEVAEGRI